MKKILSTLLLGCTTLTMVAQQPTTSEPGGTENPEKQESAQLEEIKVNGKKLPKFKSNQYQYVYNVSYQAANDYKEGCITYSPKEGEEPTVDISYNPATRIADVKVTTTAADSTNIYKIKFSRLFHQLEDPSFEKYLSGNEPLYGWHSFESATGLMAGIGKGMSPNPVSVEGGANGSKRAVKLFSKKVFMANANGNMTTGIINMGNFTPKDPSNHNFTASDSISNALAFMGKPDSVIFYAKFQAGKNNSGKCGNANFILHKKGRYRDPEVPEQKDMLVAKASQPIHESTEWTRYSTPFVYNPNTKNAPSYLLASVTTNPVPGESAGDTLYFDEVKFIYNHALTALSVKGANFDFKKDVLSYDLRGSEYSIKDVNYTIDGIGAYVVKKFDENTGIYSFTVKGNDFSTNPQSFTEYTLQFDQPGSAKLITLNLNGRPLPKFDKDNFDYAVMDKTYKDGCINYIAEDGEFAIIDVVYDPAKSIASVSVRATKGGKQNTYRIKFDKALYQFEDPGFEKFTSGLEPLYGWHSFASATGPFSGAKTLSPNPESVEDGANGSKRAVKLTSKSLWGLYANGNLTTGIINMGDFDPKSPANHNFSSLDSLNNHMLFAGRPDSVIFYAKFKAGKANADKVGRAQFILHDDVNYRDPEDEAQKYNRIGKASQLISESDEWVRYEVPFKYNRTHPSKQYLLASVTTNPVPGQSADDTLYFDEVKFVYNHQLVDMEYKGVDFVFHKDTLNYDLSTVAYNKDNLSYIVKGAGATVKEEFNKETSVLTLKVLGSDFVVNDKSFTTYTIQFDQVETGIGAITDASDNVTVYDLNGRAVRKNVKATNALHNLPAGVYIVNGKKIVK